MGAQIVKENNVMEGLQKLKFLIEHTILLD